MPSPLWKHPWPPPQGCQDSPCPDSICSKSNTVQWLFTLVSFTHTHVFRSSVSETISFYLEPQYIALNISGGKYWEINYKLQKHWNSKCYFIVFLSIYLSTHLSISSSFTLLVTERFKVTFKYIQWKIKIILNKKRYEKVGVRRRGQECIQRNIFYNILYFC